MAEIPDEIVERVARETLRRTSTVAWDALSENSRELACHSAAAVLRSVDGQALAAVIRADERRKVLAEARAKIEAIPSSDLVDGVFSPHTPVGSCRYWSVGEILAALSPDEKEGEDG